MQELAHEEWDPIMQCTRLACVLIPEHQRSPLQFIGGTPASPDQASIGSILPTLRTCHQPHSRQQSNL